MAGIYIHIPFCKQACHYCDFHFSTSLAKTDDLLLALCKELEFQQNYLGNATIDTVYFGGGTPSLLSSSQLETIWEGLNQHFDIGNLTEVTLEANPDDVSLEKALDWKSIGFNRVSLGIQTFQDPILKFLNRCHSGADAKKAFEMIIKAGFNNISSDLIFGIPESSFEWLKDDLDILLGLRPTHISTYQLTIEENTVFGKQVKQNKLSEIDEESAAHQYIHIIESLEKSNYEHYEISNFCKKGRYALHNTNYWKNEPYLGIGPSAHSFNGETRQFNLSNNALYVRKINEGTNPFMLETLTRSQKINDYILTSLRTQWGCDLKYLIEELKYDMVEAHKEFIEDLKKTQKAYIKNGKLIMLSDGKLITDFIAEKLFVE